MGKSQNGYVMFSNLPWANYVEIHHKSTEFGNKKLKKAITHFYPTLVRKGMNFVEILL